LYAK